MCLAGRDLDGALSVLRRAYEVGQSYRNVFSMESDSQEAIMYNSAMAEARRLWTLSRTAGYPAFGEAVLSQLFSRMYNAGAGRGCVHLKEVGSNADWNSAVQDAAYAYWETYYDDVTFYDEMEKACDMLETAWMEGAAFCGLVEDELSDEDVIRRYEDIYPIRAHVAGLEFYIWQRQKPTGHPWSEIEARLQLWYARWGAVVEMGKAYACSDQKMEWMLGQSEHCESCLKLSGKVKRMSYWEKMGILPRVPGATYLKCRGWNCQCSLVITTAKATPGRLPSLP